MTLKIMHFLITLKDKGTSKLNFFNPESCGIPYSEPAQLYAKMDIDDRNQKHRLEQAKSVYVDIRDFFDTEDSQNYLTTIIKPHDVLLILDELESCFIKVEDYEKCNRINEWKRKLSRNLPPDVTSDHLY